MATDAEVVKRIQSGESPAPETSPKQEGPKAPAIPPSSLTADKAVYFSELAKALNNELKVGRPDGLAPSNNQQAHNAIMTLVKQGKLSPSEASQAREIVNAFYLNGYKGINETNSERMRWVRDPANEAVANSHLKSLIDGSEGVLQKLNPSVVAGLKAKISESAGGAAANPGSAGSTATTPAVTAGQNGGTTTTVTTTSGDTVTINIPPVQVTNTTSAAPKAPDYEKLSDLSEEQIKEASDFIRRAHIQIPADLTNSIQKLGAVNQDSIKELALLRQFSREAEDTMKSLDSRCLDEMARYLSVLPEDSKVRKQFEEARADFEKSTLPIVATYIEAKKTALGDGSLSQEEQAKLHTLYLGMCMQLDSSGRELLSKIHDLVGDDRNGPADYRLASIAGVADGGRYETGDRREVARYRATEAVEHYQKEQEIQAALKRAFDKLPEGHSFLSEKEWNDLKEGRKDIRSLKGEKLMEVLYRGGLSTVFRLSFKGTPGDVGIQGIEDLISGGFGPHPQAKKIDAALDKLVKMAERLNKDLDKIDGKNITNEKALIGNIRVALQEGSGGLLLGIGASHRGAGHQTRLALDDLAVAMGVERRRINVFWESLKNSILPMNIGIPVRI